MIFEKPIIEAYKKMAYVRCDDEGLAFYFSAEDFPGLIAEPHPFESSLRHKLSGYLYHYADPLPGRIIVFDHGFGGGHRSYMKEIEMLARRGYLVFAYDHTGCMESGGENTNGMAQSLHDLNDCINEIKKSPKLSGLDISVIGHSWGGFSSLNISALHPDISHVVVLSGFVSVSELVNSNFTGFLALYRKAIMRLEEKTNPSFVGFSATETLAETGAEVLLIYSSDDALCKRVHFDRLKEALDGKANVRLILEENKGHNPNYTRDAVALLADYVRAKTALAGGKTPPSAEEKREFLASFDWDKMTEQDPAVWQEIFASLER